MEPSTPSKETPGMPAGSAPTAWAIMKSWAMAFCRWAVKLITVAMKHQHNRRMLWIEKDMELWFTMRKADDMISASPWNITMADFTAGNALMSSSAAGGCLPALKWMTAGIWS